MNDYIIDVKNVTVRFNKASENITGLKEYVIKFSKQAEKDKIKLKNSGLDKNCINILVLMKNDPFCYPPSYEKLSGDLNYKRKRDFNKTFDECTSNVKE